MGRRTLIVIPARLNSGRVERKVLQDIGGKSLIQVVHDRVKEFSPWADVVVATDSEEVEGDFERVLTGDLHNGTERCAEVVERLGYGNGDWVINIQGDNVGITKEAIERLRETMVFSPNWTLFCLHEDLGFEDLLDESKVKVVVNSCGEAIYFTRKPVPFARKHCGIYGYTASFLKEYLRWGQGRFEEYERLEQMRVLENSGTVRCSYLDGTAGMSVNVPYDLEVARELIRAA